MAHERFASSNCKHAHRNEAVAQRRSAGIHVCTRSTDLADLEIDDDAASQRGQ
jgi:hypothetical protein